VRTSVEVAAIEGKMGKESKKKNSETNAIKEVSDCAGTVHTVIEDGFEQSKEDKRQKKYKKRTEVSTTVELDGYRNEHLNVKHSEKADDDSKRKKKEKEKKRKLEPLEDNCKADKEIHKADYGKDLGHDNEVRSRKQKKRHKEGSKKDQNESLSFQVETLKDKEGDKYEGVKEHSSSQNDNNAQMENGIEHIDKKKKKNKKGRRDEEVGGLEGKMTTIALEEVGKVRENYDIDVTEKVEKKREKVEKKRKKGNKEDKDGSGGAVREMMAEELGKEGTMIEDKDLGGNNESADLIGKKKKEKVTKNGNKGKRKKPDSVETCPEDPSPKVNPKKVRFSGHVEVFPSSDGPSKGKDQNQEDRLPHGKRFTPEEDERIKEAVKNYIRAHNLDEVEGKHMVLNCKSYPQVKNCWKDIGAAFHNRTVKAIYYRAHTLLEYENESNEKRSWTEEEFELIRSFHEKNGPKWKQLTDALKAHRIHVKDTWRRIKLPNKKMGHWSQDEYQSLFDLVNTDLQAKAFEEKKSKYGMLRDNISWTAISDKLSTRTDAICCEKWYSQLTSPMVAEGNWADTDDYRMLDALYSLDACCIEDVDWDNLLDHRSGYICHKRWNQMVSHIGEHGNKSFTEHVEVLSKRYCPDLIEAREAWDSKPVVD